MPLSPDPNDVERMQHAFTRGAQLTELLYQRDGEHALDSLKVIVRDLVSELPTSENPYHAAFEFMVRGFMAGFCAGSNARDQLSASPLILVELGPDPDAPAG